MAVEYVVLYPQSFCTIPTEVDNFKVSSYSMENTCSVCITKLINDINNNNNFRLNVCRTVKPLDSLVTSLPADQEGPVSIPGSAVGLFYVGELFRVMKEIQLGS